MGGADSANAARHAHADSSSIEAMARVCRSWCRAAKRLACATRAPSASNTTPVSHACLTLAWMRLWRQRGSNRATGVAGHVRLRLAPPSYQVSLHVIDALQLASDGRGHLGACEHLL